MSELGDAIGKTHQSDIRFEITRQHENLCNFQTLLVVKQKSTAVMGIPPGIYHCRKSATVAVMYWPPLQPLWYLTNKECKMIKQTKNHPVIAVTWVSIMRIKLARIFWFQINVFQGKQWFYQRTFLWSSNGSEFQIETSNWSLFIIRAIRLKYQDMVRERKRDFQSGRKILFVPTWFISCKAPIWNLSNLHQKLSYMK